MQQTEEFTTITEFTETRFKEKGSLFIGQAYPVSSENEAEELLGQIRKKFYDATHHCYAWSLVDNSLKYSDDGEPNGTAGIRIFNAIRFFTLNNLVVVSIRYFGGTKLGVGPLGKAYYNSAFTTLQETRKISKSLYVNLKIAFDFSHISTVHHFLSKYDTKILNTLYENSAIIDCLVKFPQAAPLEKILNESLHGKVLITPSPQMVYL